MWVQAVCLESILEPDVVPVPCSGTVTWSFEWQRPSRSHIFVKFRIKWHYYLSCCCFWWSFFFFFWKQTYDANCKVHHIIIPSLLWLVSSNMPEPAPLTTSCAEPRHRFCNVWLSDVVWCHRVTRLKGKLLMRRFGSSFFCGREELLFERSDFDLWPKDIAQSLPCNILGPWYTFLFTSACPLIIW